MVIALILALTLSAPLFAQTVAGTITRPGLQPRAVAVYEGGNKVFVADQSTGNLYMYDGGTLAELAWCSIGTYVKSMVVDEAHGKLYAMVGSSASVAVVDAATGAFLYFVASGSTNAIALGYDPALGKVYVRYKGGLRQIDVVTDSVTDVGGFSMYDPQSMAVNPVTHEVFSPDVGNNLLDMVDGVSLAHTSIAGLGGYGAGANPAENKVYILFGIGPGTPIRILDRDTGQVTSLPANYNDALHIVYSSSTNRMYTSSEVDGWSTVIDGASDAYSNFGMFSSTLALGARAATRHLYYAGQTTTAVLDETTEQVQVIPVSNPSPSSIVYQDMAINQTTGRVYVINDGGALDFVTVLQDTDAPLRPMVAAATYFPTRVNLVDPVLRRVVSSWDAPNGGVYNDSITFRPANGRLYVPLATSTGDAIQIFAGLSKDGWTPPPHASIGAGGSGPLAAAFTPDGSRFYVTNKTSNDVGVLDTATNSVLTNISVGTSPWGLAMSPDGSKVYVANKGSNTVSVISTSSNTVTNTITVGSSPWGVAITPNGTKVYVVNSGAGTVSVINTTSATVSSTVTVGTTPHGLAVTQDGKYVYVGNRASSTVSVIDTATDTVTRTISVGTNPENLAAMPDNSAVLVVSSNMSGASALYVINPADFSVTSFALAENSTQAIGLAISDSTSKFAGRVTAGGLAMSGAVVQAMQGEVERGSATTNAAGDYSVFNLQAGTYDLRVSASGYLPQTLSSQSVAAGRITLANFALSPRLISLSPSQATPGGPDFTLTVTGAEFASDSVVRWNGADRSTTLVSSTQLTAAILAADIATAGTAQVTVFAAATGLSNALTFTIGNPVPSISSLSPANATVGDPDFTLTVYGANFLSSSVVKWSGISLTTTFVSGTQLTVNIPSSYLTIAGPRPITVTNPSPGGGVSNTVQFLLYPTVPSLTSLSPTFAIAGGSAFSLTVNGANFTSASVVLWNDSSRTTTYYNGTRLYAAITAADIASEGLAQVTVFTPAPGGGTSTALTFGIYSPASVWRMFGHDSAHTSRSPVKGPSTANLLWTYSGFSGQPVVGPDGTIYGRSDGSTLNGRSVAVNPNGTQKWLKSYSTGILYAAALAVGDAAVYVAHHSLGLFALNPADGATLWSYPINSTSYNAPTVGPDGTIYVTSRGDAVTTGGQVYALNPNGSLKWRWDSGTGSCGIETTPALGTNGDVYVMHNCMGLLALDANGQVKWSGRPGQVFNSPSVGPDGTIYIGASDYYFYALNPDGSQKWRVPVQHWMYDTATAISADGSTIYRGDNGGVFYAFNSSGSIRWTFNAGTAEFSATPALAANGIIYFGYDGTLYALSAADGAALWTYPLGGGSNTSPALAPDGTLYAQGYSGSTPVLYAFRPLVSDLSVALAASPEPATIGSNLTYTATVSNNGPAAASGVALADALPGGVTLVSATASQGTCSGTGTLRCTLGTLASGASATVSIVVTVTALGPLANSAGVSAYEVDNNAGNDSSTVSTTVNRLAPAISSLAPPIAGSGWADFTLTVNGSNFAPDSVVRWNGANRATAFVNGSRLDASIPAADVATTGTAQVTVFTPAPGGGESAAVPLPVAVPNPTPSVASLSPSSAIVGDTGFTLAVTGTGFVGQSVVRWNGSNRTTTFVSSTELRAAIAAEDIVSAGTPQVTVFNPAPDGGTSSGLPFSVIVPNPVPAITSLSPSPVAAGRAAFTLAVNGSGFVSTSVVRWNGGDRATTFVSASQVTAAIAATDVSAEGTAAVTVFNPAPGGGESPPVALAIDGTPPDTSITAAPSQTTNATSAAFEFSATETSTFECQLDGAGFSSCSSPKSFTGLALGAHTFQVRAIDSAGHVDATPATFTWTINNIAVLTSLSPASVLSGPSFTLTVNGTGFISGSVIRWAGNNKTTTFVSSTQLTAVIPMTDSGTPGTYEITVFNPGTGGGVSNALLFTINNHLPTLTSISPVSATAGGNALTLTVNGSYFATGAVVRWNGSDRPTTQVSGIKLTAPISAADIATAGTAQVTVFNPEPGGGLSGAVTFTINNPAPALSSVAPSTLAPGGADFTLTVNGSNFNSSSIIRWNGADRRTSLVSGTQLTALIPAADIAAGGTAQVTVYNPPPAGGLSGAVTFTIDGTPPDTSITSGPSGTVNTAGATFEFTATEGGGTFECKLDAGSFAACTSPKSYTSLADGGHTFEVGAIDAVGNTDATPASRTWSIDTAAPDTSISAGPSGTVSTGNATFEFTATEAGSTFECKLDAGSFAACTSPKSYTALADGSHGFQVRAIDAAGNVDATPASRTWTIDTAAPDTSITSGPSGTVNTASATFEFTATEVGSTFECKLDTGSFAACTSPKSYTSLADGGHTFEVRAIDAVGNTDQTPASRGWTVDTTPPDTSITSGPSGTVNTASATFEFTATEAASTFECKLDTGSFAACTSPKSYTALADGSHGFQVRAIDAVGNVDTTPASRAWTIDTAAPDTSISAGPSGTVNTASATFEFTATEAGSTFECKLDAGSFAACTSPKTYSGLADGGHAFEVRAIDAVGNTAQTPASRTWTIDTAAPDTSISAGPSGTANTASARFEFTATEAGSTFECRLDAGSFAACTSPKSYTSLPDGGHTFEVRAIDAVGNTDQTPASRTWTIDTAAPDTSISAGPSGTVNTASATFEFTATEAGSTFECKLDTGSFAACTSPKSYTSLADGGHTFEVRAIDAVGNTDQTPASRAWTIDTAAPDTSITVGPTGSVNTASPTFEFTATEAGGTFECKLDAGSFAACTSPKSYTSLADGGHTFEVRAIDAVGNADATSASRAWTIDTAAPDTSITVGPTGSVRTANATFEFTATEAGSTFECKLDAGSFAACTSPKSYTSLLDGGHAFEVRAIDAVGNTDQTPASRTWTIDTAAPDTSITSAPSGTVNTASATFEFTATEAGSTFECKLDAGSFAACTSPKSYTSLLDGGHAFEVRAIDAVGNTDQTPASRTWTIDTAAPDTSITVGPTGSVNTASATFEFTATEAGSTFECKLDAGSFAACTSPKSYTSLPDGGHTFEVRAIDAVGNADATPASRAWTIDTAAPDTSITVGPTGSVRTANATFEFTATEAGSTFECKLDAGSFAACTSPKSYTSLPDGGHTFEVRAVDAVGNTDQTPASRTWTIDTAAPDTSITVGPTGTVSTGNVTFEFTATEAGGTFECKLDAGSFAACTSPKTYSGLADGGHAFEVRAVDAVGNTDQTPASRTWTIDTAAPATTISAGPSGTVNTASATFEFTATEAGSTFQCALDGGAFAACTSPKTYSGLADGSHTFAVRAVDAVGNTDQTPASRTWTIDTAAPDTSITVGPTGTVSTGNVTFEFTATEADSTFECKLDAGNFAACMSPKSYTSLADGSHTFAVRAMDALGNTDQTPASRTWTIDTAAPDTSISVGPSGTVNTANATFEFTATEAGGTFECKLDAGNFAACTSPKTYSGLADGGHAFEVRAVDAVGNTDQMPASRTWTIDTAAPATTISAGPSGTVSTGNATFEFTATEAGSTFQCALDGGAFAACTSPKSYSGLADGGHAFEVRAVDAVGNTDQTPASRAWTIDTAAPDTSITVGPTGTVSTGNVTFEFTATEADSTFECKLDAGSFAACMSPKSYTSLADGSHTFAVRAMDALGNTDQTPATRTWVVLTPNPAPVLTALSPSSVFAGGPGFTLIVDGTGFVNGAVVRWNGADRVTTFISSTRVTATVLLGDVAAAGLVQVTVFNPAPGGGSSAPLVFTIVENAHGVVAAAGGQAVPGGLARLPISLTLDTGISIDTHFFAVRIVPLAGAPPLEGSLDFAPDPSLPAFVPDTAGAADYISIAWLAPAISPALSGTRFLGSVVVRIPSGAQAGQSYSVQVTSAGGALGMVEVALACGPTATLTITRYDYLVGDSAPSISQAGDLNGDGDTTDAGEFGDGRITIVDLILALRTATGVLHPQACTDLFDAMDSFPLDTTAKRGGDGQISILDLIMTLRRATGVDTTLPRRSSRGLACPAGAPVQQPAPAAFREPARRPDTASDAALEAGTPARGDDGNWQIPVFVSVRSSFEWAGLAFAVMADDAVRHPRLGFLPAAGQSQPTLVDDQVAGTISLAWLDGLSLSGDRRTMLGYIVFPGGPEASDQKPASLRFGQATADARDGRRIRVNVPGTDAESIR